MVRSAMAIGMAALAALAGCNSGSVSPCCDLTIDFPPSVLDSTIDAPGDATSDGARDGVTPPSDGVRAEGTTPHGDGASEGGPPDPCLSWSNWTCSTSDTTFLCKATCNGSATLQALNCLASGDCICGVGLGPCGKFGNVASGCDACRKAVEADCCKLKGP